MTRQNPYPSNTFEHSQWNNRQGLIESANRYQPPGPRSTSGRPFLSQPSRPVVDANQWKQWANEVNRDNVNGPWDRVQRASNPTPTATTARNATQRVLESPAQASRIVPPTRNLVNRAARGAGAIAGPATTVYTAGEILNRVKEATGYADKARNAGRNFINNPSPRTLADAYIYANNAGAYEVFTGAIDELRQRNENEQISSADIGKLTGEVITDPANVGATTFTLSSEVHPGGSNCPRKSLLRSATWSGYHPPPVTVTLNTSGGSCGDKYGFRLTDGAGNVSGLFYSGIGFYSASITGSSYDYITPPPQTSSRPQKQPDYSPPTYRPPTASINTSPLKTENWQPDRNGNFPRLPIPPVVPAPQKIEQQPPELAPQPEYLEPTHQQQPGVPPNIARDTSSPEAPTEAPAAAPDNTPEPDPGKELETQREEQRASEGGLTSRTTTYEGEAAQERIKELAKGAGTGALIGGLLVGGEVIVDNLRGNETGTEASGKRKVPPPKVPVNSPPNCGCNNPLLQRFNQIDNKLDKALGVGAETVSTGAILDKLNKMQQFAERAWEQTRLQKVLDVLTFLAAMHNVAMLSRGVGFTFLEVVSQGLQAVGIRDEEGNPLDVPSLVTGGIENLLRSVLGNEVYNGTAEAWNKANRIISTASAVIWSIRSIADVSRELMEWVAENTGKIGNALKKWRVVGQDAYPWMSERPQARYKGSLFIDKATGAVNGVEERISVYGEVTGNVIELQEEFTQAGENLGNFRESVINGIPDPWQDNEPVQGAEADAIASTPMPEISIADSQKN